MVVPGDLATEAIRDILYEVERDAASTPRVVHCYDIASHLHIKNRREADYLLRKRLRIRDAAEVTRQVKGMDGRRYVESFYASDDDDSLAVVERRRVTSGSEPQFFLSCLVVVPGQAFTPKGGLFGRGRTYVPSRKLEDFLNIATMWVEPLDLGPHGEIADMSDDEVADLSWFNSPLHEANSARHREAAAQRAAAARKRLAESIKSGGDENVSKVIADMFGFEQTPDTGDDEA